MRTPGDESLWEYFERSRFDEGMAASDASGYARWSAAEREEVRLAIEACAVKFAFFTADDVWKELGPDFLVTKGLAGRLNAAVNAGLIDNTGKTSHSKRTNEHGHAQRLTIWRSLIYRAKAG